MSKHRGRRIGGPAGPQTSQSGMMRQLENLQGEMLKAQEEVAALVVTSTAGGGAVTAMVTGERRVQSLAIAQEVVNPDDVEMLQDLIVAAINDALERVDQSTAERMSALTGGLSIPGLL